MFRAQLVAAGLRWTGAFRLKPPRGSNEYWIVGASGHLAGYESIKEGLGAVDERHGQGFATSQPAPPGQQTLGFDEPEQGPDTEPLLQALREHFGTEPFTVEQAEAFRQTTRFLRTHLKRLTLARAERAGQLEVARPAGARQFAEGRGITMRFV